MKKICFMLLGLMNLMVVSAGFGQVQPPGRIVLRCADVHAFGYPTIEGVRYLDQVVQKRTGGRIQIKIYPESSLGSEKSVVEMVQLGLLDMGRVSMTQAAEVDHQLGVLVLPYLFEDDEHKWRVLNGPVGKRLLAGLSRYNLIGLCFQESGYRSFYNSKRPVYRPQDLKGLKLRVQPSRIMVKLVESLGAAPVPINYGDVYAALSAGVIDGAENNIPSYYTSGHYRVAQYFSFDRHASIPEILLVSRDTWMSLKESDRQIIIEAARESVEYQRRQWAQFEEDCRRKLEAAGCKFNEVDLVAFKAAIDPFYQDYRKEYRDLMEAIEKAR